MQKHCLLLFPKLVALLSASFSLMPKPVTAHVTLPAKESHEHHVHFTFPTVLLTHVHPCPPPPPGNSCSAGEELVLWLLFCTHLPRSQSTPGCHVPSFKEALCDASSRASHLPPGLRPAGRALARRKESRSSSQWKASCAPNVPTPLITVSFFFGLCNWSSSQCGYFLADSFLHLSCRNTPSRPFHSSPTLPRGVETPAEAVVEF